MKLLDYDKIWNWKMQRNEKQEMSERVQDFHWLLEQCKEQKRLMWRTKCLCDCKKEGLLENVLKDEERDTEPGDNRNENEGEVLNKEAQVRKGLLSRIGEETKE